MSLRGSTKCLRNILQFNYFLRWINFSTTRCSNNSWC